ncbi:MAG: helicase type I site-specific restriction-modification system restriction subunit [Bacteroidetes bacterium]|nr:MAG: helicase type I site-specific restriction-modification system restriction subunit [Bacteroidota bacterium]
MTNNTNKNPEQIARDRIDGKLRLAGWVIQDKKKIDFSAAIGIAVKEYLTEVGPADYVLFVDRKPVGVIEAKKEEEGENITVVEDQSGNYAASKLKHINNEPLPYIYESTGVITRFTNAKDPKPRAKNIFSFHRPETIKFQLKNERTLRSRLFDFPALNKGNLRECQYSAIKNLEISFEENRPKALIQMATGAGKTFTAISSIYRLLEYADAKRILFLVDTKNLGEQAEQEFMAFIPPNENRTFTELYTVQRLTSSFVNPDAHVCISTIQRLYSILKGEELDEKSEEENPNEKDWQPKEPLPVIYNEKIPIEFFDFIVIDECHRSIYNLWRQVLEYFDAFLIGLTATPDKRTFGFFNENIVSEYTHEEAVADGVNVTYDTYLIETKITKAGAVIEAKEFVDKRERLSRRKRWEQLDEEVAYAPNQLDKDIVNPSQIRNVIKAFKQKLPEIFPGRAEVPKTLIFAKTDSHADDIINIVREEFGEGNSFCKKITYQTEDNPKTVLSSFRNDYFPRIAVTVDMIATGTDVKPLECLIFMRNVKSKGYFEQMKGRGTRTIKLEDLKKVTPSAIATKDHFVIVDAIGVMKTTKTDSRPLERKRGIPLKDLMYAAMMGNVEEDLFVSLAGRLGRIEKQITPDEKKKFQELAKGKTINQMVKDLLDVFDPDKVQAYSVSKYGNPTPAQVDEAQIELAKQATISISGELIEYVDNVRKSLEQIIDIINIDELEFAGWDTHAQEKALELVANFKEYIEVNKDEIVALSWFYSQPYQRKELTYKMVKELLEKLKADKPTLAPLRIWQAYEHIDNLQSSQPLNEMIALVSLIRRVMGLDEKLTPYNKAVDKRFQDWVFKKQAGTLKYSEEQMTWLRMIKDHIATSFHLEKDDLDYSPFDSKGGLMKIWQLFGDNLDVIIDELNKELAA